jgi:hypothetical protein
VRSSTFLSRYTFKIECIKQYVVKKCAESMEISCQQRHVAMHSYWVNLPTILEQPSRGPSLSNLAALPGYPFKYQQPFFAIGKHNMGVGGLVLTRLPIVTTAGKTKHQQGCWSYVPIPNKVLPTVHH